jgi:hypothetical protein
MKKTIFIVVTRGFIVRNILRTGVLDFLKKANARIVIFFPLYGDRVIPQYLRNEFEDLQVSLIGVKEPQKKGIVQKINKLFSKLSSQLVFTLTTWKYNLIGKKSKMQRAKIWSYLEMYVYTVLSKIHFLKKIARAIEQHVFRDTYYGEYFTKYKPDVVFSTSIMSKLDIQFMKEAKSHGVKTVSMPKGWDNVAKLLYRVVPDISVFHNNVMKEHAIKEQRIDPDTIVVSGFPQFDMYKDQSILLSRNEYLKKIGLDLERKLLFFGSEGSWTPQDDTIADFLVSYVANDTLGEKVSLIIRPHFSDIKAERFNRFKNIAHVWVDDSITISDFFWDNWDPSMEETKLFINTLYHSAVTISIASTLALDACVLDKPVVAVGFKALYHPITKKDITKRLYDSDHYQSVLQTNAIDLVLDEKAFQASLKAYLADPKIKTEERTALIEKLCYKIDGNSSKRIVDAILSSTT